MQLWQRILCVGIFLSSSCWPTAGMWKTAQQTRPCEGHGTNADIDLLEVVLLPRAPRRHHLGVSSGIHQNRPRACSETRIRHSSKVDRVYSGTRQIRSNRAELVCSVIRQILRSSRAERVCSAAQRILHSNKADRVCSRDWVPKRPLLRRLQLAACLELRQQG